MLRSSLAALAIALLLPTLAVVTSVTFSNKWFQERYTSAGLQALKPDLIATLTG